jgi:hypothetical protein
MAEPTRAAPHAEASAQGAKATNAGPLLVVDIGKKQSKKRIRDLRKGEGKLFEKITLLVEEMKERGTMKGDVQPLVIVVRKRERRLLGW